MTKKTRISWQVRPQCSRRPGHRAGRLLRRRLPAGLSLDRGRPSCATCRPTPPSWRTPTSAPSWTRSSARGSRGAADARAGQKEFQAQTGIDIERDIDYVVAALTLRRCRPGRRPLVVARGRFNDRQLEGSRARARRHGRRVQGQAPGRRAGRRTTTTTVPQPTTSYPRVPRARPRGRRRRAPPSSTPSTPS